MTVNYLEQTARPQALVRETPFHQWSFPDDTIWTLFYRQVSGYLVRFPELGDFEISGDGRNVKGWATANTSSATFQHLFLNQVLPLALSRQGKLVLHASAVDLDGSGVAFVGESGRGKSTLAASFATTGMRFLTDDGLYLEWVAGQCRITPSHPSIRLWEDSQEALIGDAVAMAPALDFTTKTRFLSGADIVYCDEARPLRRVYFLGEDEASSVTMERMKPSAALIELAKHFFLLDMGEQEMLARHFDELCRLAALPIYFRLDYPRRYEDLPGVREAIMRHTLDESAMP